MPVTKEQIWQALRTVRDPQRDGDIVTLNEVRGVAACDGVVTVRVTPSGPAAVLKDKLTDAIIDALHKLGPEVTTVNVDFDAPPATHPTQTPQPAAASPAAAAAAKPPTAQAQARTNNPLPGVKQIIAVGAGKGGVGKSTIAVAIAVGLARRGLRVGLLDGDIYGPSAPTLLGLADLPVNGTQQTLYPFEVHGIKTMTIGKLVEADKPLIWRGPMAHGAFRQLALQTDWGDLDYMIVDLPPGTGDVSLTLAQMLPVSGAVIVCTPQKVAQDDAVRAAGMFRQLEIPVLGVVENMSYFVGDDGKEYDIFGRGGAAAMATRLHLPLLGQVPIHMELRRNSDTGNATANFEGNPQLAAALVELVDNVLKQVDANPDLAPTLTIS
jgi:ATP-binding protein involved in chromosome partitioning